MKVSVVNKRTGTVVHCLETNYEMTDQAIKEGCGIIPEDETEKATGRYINGVFVPFDDLIVQRPPVNVAVKARKATEEEKLSMMSDAQLQQYQEEKGIIPRSIPRVK